MLTNNGPLDAAEYNEPFDELEANLDALIAQETDELIAGKLNDTIKEIQALTKAAEKDRKAVKEPHLAASKRVDADYMPLKTRGTELAARGKARVTEYLVEQQRIADEARRKAEAEEAERARIAAEMADDALVGDMVNQEAEEAAQAANVARAEYENAGRAGSLTGQSRVMSLRTIYQAEIDDYQAAAAHFASHPKVQDAILAAANSILRGPDRPDSLPGIIIKKIQKAA